MDNTMICRDDRRPEAVREKRGSGLDYLEVGDDRRTLTVILFGEAPDNVGIENVRIDGGRRIRGIQAAEVSLCPPDNPGQDNCLRVVVSKPGDSSTYTLRIVKPGTDEPLQRFDPRYASLDFTFHAGPISALDCHDA